MSTDKHPTKDTHKNPPCCVQCGKQQPWLGHTVRYCSDECKETAGNGVIPVVGAQQYRERS